MSLAEVYEKVRPACVAIACTRVHGDGVTQYLPIGRGACINSRGLVVTAAHVVKPECQMLIEEKREGDPFPLFVFFPRTTARGHEFPIAPVKAIAINATYDLAYLRLPEYPGGALPSIPLPAEPSRLLYREGTEVAAAGYPERDWDYALPFPHLVSGVVSLVHYDFVPGDEGAAVLKQLDLDLVIHPGNSGGPVVHAETGALIGIIRSRMATNIAECEPFSALHPGISSAEFDLDAFFQGLPRLPTQ